MWFIIISLVFFFLGKLQFSGFLREVCKWQNNSKYRAPLKQGLQIHVIKLVSDSAGHDVLTRVKPAPFTEANSRSLSFLL